MKTLDELYALIPRASCKSGCTRCCGPVPFSPEEKERVNMPWRFEGIFAKHNPLSLTCTFAVPGTGCEIYENRPLICRIFGATPCFYCPEFPNPDPKMQLTASETMAIMFEYFEMFPEPDKLFDEKFVGVLKKHDEMVGLRKEGPL